MSKVFLLGANKEIDRAKQVVEVDFPKEQRGRFAQVGKPQLTNRLFTRGGAIRPTIPKEI